MRYLFQRVVHNWNNWEAPSSGRLQSTGDGGYLETTGFGHEDWNLSRDICGDGYSYGYMYFQPKDASETFNILFATYDKGEGWALCGYYLNAAFIADGAAFPREIVYRRASELKALDNASSLGGDYQGKTVSKIINLLFEEAIHYRWRVRPKNIHRFPQPIRVPKSMTSRFGAYFTRPTGLQESEWDALTSFSAELVDKPRQDDYSDGGDIEFPEGKEYEVRHKTRERNKKLVIQAKADFKLRHGRLYCEACDFDFATNYGNVGDGFIEVHHIIPVSELPSGAKTKISDLALVCSNCHRMLHRRRPWLTTVQALRSLMKQVGDA